MRNYVVKNLKLNIKKNQGKQTSFEYAIGTHLDSQIIVLRIVGLQERGCVRFDHAIGCSHHDINQRRRLVYKVYQPLQRRSGVDSVAWLRFCRARSKREY